jgi:hypothetical protein
MPLQLLVLLSSLHLTMASCRPPCLRRLQRLKPNATQDQPRCLGSSLACSRWPWRLKCAREAGPRFQRTDDAKCKQTSRGAEAVRGRRLERRPPEMLIAAQRFAVTLCAGFSALNMLSPNSELKPSSVKGAVRAEKAGELCRWQCSQRRRPADNARPPTRHRWRAGVRRRRP